MTGELESFLREIVEGIHKSCNGHASWIHLNRGQHQELKGFPLDTLVATIHSVPIFLSDVALGKVRY